MNTNLGLIGKKLGNTQIFLEDGTVSRVTAIEVGPCIVLGKRTEAEHGYSALQLGFGERSEKRVNKPEAGLYKKLGSTPARIVRELRLPASVVEKVEVGQSLKAADLFVPGMFVDVSGTSKGRGFTGVMRRHNFRGAGTNSHGTHEYRRHGGSIGQNMTPGRTFPNMGMPGQYGNERVTILNLKIAQVLADQNILLVEGAVPGPRDGIVTVRGAVKKKPAEIPLASANA